MEGSYDDCFSRAVSMTLVQSGIVTELDKRERAIRIVSVMVRQARLRANDVLTSLPHWSRRRFCRDRSQPVEIRDSVLWVEDHRVKPTIEQANCASPFSRHR